MTGSTDLSVEQLQTLHHEITRHENLIRVVMHPAALPGKDVIVETHSITHGDVVVGHFYLRRSGERMTKAAAADSEELEWHDPLNSPDDDVSYL